MSLVKVGDQFGSLQVVSLYRKWRDGDRLSNPWAYMAECSCVCGGSKSCERGNLKAGKVTRCDKCAVCALGAVRGSHGHSYINDLRAKSGGIIGCRDTGRNADERTGKRNGCRHFVYPLLLNASCVPILARRLNWNKRPITNRQANAIPSINNAALRYVEGRDLNKAGKNRATFEARADCVCLR